MKKYKYNPWWVIAAILCFAGAIASTKLDTFSDQQIFGITFLVFSLISLACLRIFRKKREVQSTEE
jgi:Sec-independent protein secretion pathway component TatC